MVSSFFFFFWWWYWCLNSGLALARQAWYQLEAHLQLKWLILDVIILVGSVEIYE
jgi:hypothetical protein